MEMIFEHTQAWLNGERMEGIIVTVFGIVTILLVVGLWLFSTSTSGRALILPILLCGIAYTGIGASLIKGSHNRTETYRSMYEKDAVKFIETEKKRVEDFQYMYVISKVVAVVTFIATLLIFWLTKSPVWQAWGIGLAYFGLAGLVVDYFSQHRALEYYEVLNRVLSQFGH